MKCVRLLPMLAVLCCLPGMAQATETSPAAASAVPAAPAGYRCPMAEHETIYAAPGECPLCRMKLEPVESLRKRMKNVAILVFDGVQIIDSMAPYEVFGQAGFDVYTVAVRPGPITTAMGMSMNPRYDLATCPKPDILVLPGGDVDASVDDPKLIGWIQQRSAEAEVVLSVCTGAFFLARAGLLDGLQATTFAPMIDALQAAAPKAKVVRDQRFVDNGKIVTAAGLSSGLEGALHVVEKVRGKGWAQRIAMNMEYHWQPELNWARASMPDRLIQLETPPEMDFQPLLTQGTAERWQKRWSVSTDQTTGQLFDLVNGVLEHSNHWSRKSSDASTAGSVWTFTDDQGKTWNANVHVEALQDPTKTQMLDISIERSGAAPALQGN